MEKPPFELPGRLFYFSPGLIVMKLIADSMDAEFIRETGIMEMRNAMSEVDEAGGLKGRQRGKMKPKMGRLDIDYQKLHDAFFRFQTKPKLSRFGDMY